MLLVIFSAGTIYAEMPKNEPFIVRDPFQSIGPDLSIAADASKTRCSVLPPPPPTLYAPPVNINLTTTSIVTLRPGSFQTSGVVTIVFEIKEDFTNSTRAERTTLSVDGGSTSRSVSMFLSGSFSPVGHKVTLVVDPVNYLPERDETNNTYQFPMTCS